MTLPPLKPYWDFDCEYTPATDEDIKNCLASDYGLPHLHVDYKEYLAREADMILALEAALDELRIGSKKEAVRILQELKSDLEAKR